MVAMIAERRTSNGSRWPRRAARPDRWSTFRYLVLREAMYTAGAHPFLTHQNRKFRIQLRDATDDQVVSMFHGLIAAWPARKHRR